MPLYAYRCTQCGHRFEKIQNFSAKPEKECPKCHGLLERPLTAPRLHFKGAGWYVNDYGAKTSPSDSESAPAPSTGASTPESKPSTTATDSAASSPAPASAPAPASTPSSTPSGSAS